MSKPGIVDKISQYQARKRYQGYRFLFIAFCVAVVMCTIVSIVGAVLAFIEESQVTSQYGEQIARMCNPVPQGANSPENMPQGETPLRIVMLKADTSLRHTMFKDTPAVWRAENAEQTQIVACIEEEEISLEICPYLRDDGEGTFTVRWERIQHKTRVKLFNASNGRGIDEILLEGELPDACPEDIPEGSGSRTLEGEEPAFEDLVPWLEPYIFAEVNT